MRGFIHISIAAFLLFGAIGPVEAATRTWDNDDGDHLFSNPNNWSANTLPIAGDDAIFDGTSTDSCFLDILISVRDIRLLAGYTGEVVQGVGTIFGITRDLRIDDGSFSCSNDGISAGRDLDLNGGTFNAAAGDITVGRNLDIVSGTFNAGGGDLSVTNNVTMSGTYNAGTGDITVSNNFTMSAGSFACGSGKVFIGNNFTQSAGSFTATSDTLDFFNNAIFSGGTFAHNDGIVQFLNDNQNFQLNGRKVFNTIILEKTDAARLNLQAGDTLEVLGNFFAIEGDIRNADLMIAHDTVDFGSGFDRHDVDIEFVGSGNQRFFIGNDALTSNFSVFINLMNSGDTLNMTSDAARFSLDADGEYIHVMTGSFVNGSSTVVELVVDTVIVDPGAVWYGPSDSLLLSGGMEILGTFQSSSTILVCTNDDVIRYNFSPSQRFSQLIIQQPANGDELNIAAGDTVIVTGLLSFENGRAYGGVYSAEGDVQVLGDFDDNATSVIAFMGSGNQNLDMDTDPDGYDGNFVIDKPSGELVLQTEFEIDFVGQNFEFVDGIVNGNGNLFWVENDATVGGASNASYVDGQVRKEGDDAFTFPVGDGGVYAGIAISAPTAGGHHFTAQYFFSTPSASYDPDSRDTVIKHIGNCEYWILDRTNGGSDVTVELAYQSSRSCEINDPNRLLVARWDGSAWRTHGASVINNFGDSGSVVSNGAVTAFSPFTLASYSAGNNLPIELISFNARAEDKESVLEWSTATETNNAYFSIERSADGVNFEEIGRLAGAGMSYERLDYRWVDRTPRAGINYYRLRQTDFDGSSEVSRVRVVEFAAPSAIATLVYPNPTDGLLKVRSGGNFSSAVIYDLSGRMLSSADAAGQETIELSLLGYPAGMYLLRLEGAESSELHRIRLR